MTNKTLETEELTASGRIPARIAVAPTARVGPYRLVREIGHGGMGVVHEAIDDTSGSRVAIKMVSDCNRGLLAALRSEVIALRQVKHPYIVSIVDEGLSAPVPWYAMDYVEGQTLAAFNDDLWGVSKKGLPQSVSALSATRTTSDRSGPPRRPVAAAGRLTEVIESFHRLCDALMHVHAQGIVHRDLKPSNVMLRSDGSPVLMDFGISSRAFGRTGRDQLDLMARFMGSALYAAPEQIRGEAVSASQLSLEKLMSSGQPGNTGPQHGVPSRRAQRSAIPSPRSATYLLKMGFEGQIAAHEPRLKTVLYLDGFPTPDD